VRPTDLCHPAPPGGNHEVLLGGARMG